MATSQEKIKEALLELLETLPFSEINITSVCAKAGLSRRTFNRYYASLEEVVKDQVRDDVVAPAELLMNVLPANVLRESPSVAYITIYRIVYSHQTFYRRIVQALGSMWLVQTVMEAGSALNDRAYARNDIPPAEVDYAQHFFLGLNAMTIKWWVEGDFRVSPEELARLIMSWGYGHLESLPRID